MDDIDKRIGALFAGSETSPADDGFTERVLALVQLDRRLTDGRRAAVRRMAIEGAGLAGMLIAFVAFARATPAAQVIPLTSPAMLGLILLGSWLAIGVRGTPHAG